MKKLFIIWCCVIAVAILMGIAACASAEVYPQTFIVDLVNYDQDFLILTDFTGNEWRVDGVEDYDCGDIVAAIMDDNNTPIIYDDIIIDMRYTGYLEGWQ